MKKREYLITKRFPDGYNKNWTILSGKDKFCVGTYNLIIDTFYSEFGMRIKTYSIVM